jgi:hypothetical protein
LFFKKKPPKGGRLIEEKMVLRESDIDVASVLGFGFPAQVKQETTKTRIFCSFFLFF